MKGKGRKNFRRRGWGGGGLGNRAVGERERVFVKEPKKSLV